MVNRIADNLPPDNPPPDEWWEEPDDDDEDDDDESDDWACATVRDLNEVSDDLDTHLKDYAAVRERVTSLERAVQWLGFLLAAVGVLFVLHLMAGR